MALLLNIDCATEYASVCISSDENVIAFQDNREQKEHASFLQAAIKELAEKSGVSLREFEAIAVSYGPGSYTGLRVGMASAKGLCYSLNIPLITINTLEVMAQAAIEKTRTEGEAERYLFCPMIDARRMEVFTAIFKPNLEAIVEPAAMIVDEGLFTDILQKQQVVFSGSGIGKSEEALKSPNAIFLQIQHSAKDLAVLGAHLFRKNKFADLAYSEPFYLKEFYTLK